MLYALGQIALSILAPPHCAACDAPLPRDAIFCAVCAATVSDVPCRLDGGRAAAGYGGAVSTAIVRFKFHGRTDLARPLSHLLFAVATRSATLRAVDLVIPVPLHADRLIERGYNQASLLARPLARFLGVPFAPRLLERTRAAVPQASLGAKERASNLIGCFRARPGQLLRGKRVLLVDDVRTTGATLESSGKALMEVGVKSVQFITVAQA